MSASQYPQQQNEIPAGTVRNNPTLRGVGCGIVAAAIWGSYLAVSHQGVAAGLAPSDLAFIRYATAAMILAPWLIRSGAGNLAGVGWARGLALASLAGPLFVMIGSSGYRFAPFAHAVIQPGSLTVSSFLLASILLGERAGMRRLAGLGVIIAGLAVTSGPSLLAGQTGAVLGDLLFVGAGTMWGLFTVLQRRWKVLPLAATAAVSVISGAVYAPIYLASEGLDRLVRAEPCLLAEQIVVQGLFGGVIALLAFSRAVQDLGATRAALFTAMAPGIALLVGIPLGGGTPTGLQIVGLLVLSIGIVIAVTDGYAGPAFRAHPDKPAIPPAACVEPRALQV